MSNEAIYSLIFFAAAVRSAMSHILLGCVSATGTIESNPPIQRLRADSSAYWLNPPLEGFLLKKGAKGISPGYKRRWFLLSEGHMYYYKTSSAINGSELGFIDLRGQYTLEYEPEVDTFSFRLRTPQRLWYLTAEAEEECTFWVQGISALKRRQAQPKRSVADASLLHSRIGSLYDAAGDFEDKEELKKLLTDAEEELESKQHHVDDLYADLQNSLQVIKVRGEQIEIMNKKLEERDKEIVELRKAAGTEEEEALHGPISSTSSYLPTNHKEFLLALSRDMECFVEYLEGELPEASSRIAISKWIHIIQEHQENDP